MTSIASEALTRRVLAEQFLGRRITAAEERAISHIPLRGDELQSGFRFERLLKSILAEQFQGPLQNAQAVDLAQRTPQNASILSLNPHMNLRVITQAHPGATLVFEDGNFKLEVKMPEPLPPEQERPEAMGMAQALAVPLEIASGLAQRKVSGDVLQVQVQDNLGAVGAPNETSFGLSLAASAWGHLFQGSSLPPPAEIRRNDSLSALLAPRWQTQPIPPAASPFGLSEAVTYWDKISV